MIQNFHDKATRAFGARGIVAEFNILKCIPYMPRITFVCALFRLENPYSDDFNYVSGMFRLIKDLPRRFKNFSLRVYMDDSVLMKDEKWRPLYNELFKHEFITVIRYNFPQFKRKNSVYHDGLFGTVIRLIPLFRFNKIHELTVNIDIDGKPDKYLVHMKFIKSVLDKMRVQKNSLILMSYNPILVINDLRHRALNLGLYGPADTNVRFSMYGVFCTRKIDPGYFLDWFACVKSGCPVYTKWAAELRREIDCTNETSRVSSLCSQMKANVPGSPGVFFYGIDEFLLTYLGNRLYSDKVQYDVLAAVPELLEIHKFIWTYRDELFSPGFIRDMYTDILAEQSTGDPDSDFLVVDGLYAHARDQTFLMNSKIMKSLYLFLNDSVKSGYLRASLRGPEILRKYVEHSVALVSKFEYSEYFYGRRSLVGILDLVSRPSDSGRMSRQTRKSRNSRNSRNSRKISRA